MNPLKLSTIAFKCIVTNKKASNLFAVFSTNQVFTFLYSVIEDEYDRIYVRFGFFHRHQARYSRSYYHKVPISKEDELKIEELTSKNFWTFVGKFRYGKSSKAKLYFVRELIYEEVKLEYSKCIRINALNNELLRFMYIKINRYLTTKGRSNDLLNVHHIDEAKNTGHKYLNSKYWIRLDFGTETEEEEEMETILQSYRNDV